MEEKRLSEKESLELISRMIQTTRENMKWEAETNSFIGAILRQLCR